MVLLKGFFLIRITSLLIILSLIISSGISAQQLPPGQQSQPAEYSDEELIEFIHVAQKVMPLQQESQIKMIGEIEEQELTVEKFNNILESTTTGLDVVATEEEMEAFNNAVENIKLLQEQYMEMISEVIVVEGMTTEKYEEIIFSYQQDPQLQLRINQLMEEMDQPQ
jgi:hypothetical protein